MREEGGTVLFEAFIIEAGGKGMILREEEG